MEPVMVERTDTLATVETIDSIAANFFAMAREGEFWPMETYMPRLLDCLYAVAFSLNVPTVLAEGEEGDSRQLLFDFMQENNEQEDNLS